MSKFATLLNAQFLTALLTAISGVLTLFHIPPLAAPAMGALVTVILSVGTLFVHGHAAATSVTSVDTGATVR